MTRAELDAAIQRVIDAELCSQGIRDHALRTTGDLINARREIKDARADLDDLLNLLDYELAFTPPITSVGRSQL